MRLLCILTAFAAAVAARAEPPASRFTFTEVHMGTEFKLILYAPDRETAGKAAAAAFARIADLDATMTDYKPQQLDTKWQQQWASTRAFEVEIDPTRPKFYCLEMFAYPSGHAHVGHVRNYIIGDVMARMKRLRQLAPGSDAKPRREAVYVRERGDTGA